MEELVQLSEAELDDALPLKSARMPKALPRGFRISNCAVFFQTRRFKERDTFYSSGAGGTESQDWASMLLRMYLRWTESHGFATETMDYQDGEEPA